MMLGAAALEVGGDALIRRGLQGSGAALVVAGFCILGAYGIVVNLVGLDFSRLLGAYVGWFALVSVCAGKLFFGDRIPFATWLGLGIVFVGSLVVQFGPRT
jgi:drug/metabolite transporter superfamily protein YnfA